eukprot:51920_1
MVPIGNILLTLLGLLSTIIIVIMLIHFIKHEYKYNKYGCKIWKSSGEVKINIFIFISYTIFALYTTMNRTYSIISSYTNFNPHWCISSSFEMFLFTIPKVALYIFFIMRLHHVFGQSAMAVSLLKLKIFALITCTPLLINAFFGCLHVYKRAQYLLTITDSELNALNITNFVECERLSDHYTTTALNIIKYVGIMLYLLAELIFSILILRLFLSRVLILSMTYEKMVQRIQERHNKLGKVTSINRLKSFSITSEQSKSNPEVSHTPNTSEREETKDKNFDESRARSQTYSEKIEAQNSKKFLNLAIKTTNLIIMAVCSNFLILIKFGLNVPTAILNIDVICNCASVYLSYHFAKKYYTFWFKPCHHLFYGCCTNLCYCCCLSAKLHPLDDVQQEQKQENHKTNDSAIIVYSDTEMNDDKSNVRSIDTEMTSDTQNNE